MNDSSNFGADFHCAPNSIITLKGEDLPQPRNGAPTTSDAYVSQLRTDPYAANLVLAVPGISTSTSANLITNGTFDNGTSNWTADSGATLTNPDGVLRITVTSTAGASQTISVVSGKRYTLSFKVRTDGTNFANFSLDLGGIIQYVGNQTSTDWTTVTKSFTSNTTGNATLKPYKATGGWAEFDDIVFKQEGAPRDYSADIKGSGTNKTLTANGNAGVGYEIPSYYGSAMTFDGTGDYFSTTSGASDFDLGTDDFTIEGWVYPQSFSNFPTLINIKNTTASSDLYINFRNSSTLALTNNTTVFAGSSGFALNQWNHFAIVRSSGSTTMYGNGVAGAPVACSIDFGASFTGTTIGSGPSGGDPLSGYIQDVRVYKGVSKYKGGFDVPKPYTPVGIESWRQVSDICQNNFATWNPLDVYQNAGAGGPATLSGGNLITGSNDNVSTHSNFGVTSGKWYYESVFSQGINNSDGLGVVAQYEKGYNGTSDGGYYILYRDNGGLFIGNGTSRYDPPAGTYRSWGPNDVISVGIDVDNREVIFFNKGVEELRYPFPSHVADGAVWMPAILNRQAGYIYTNFGQNPTFSGQITAGTYTDSNGKGLFKYQPPSGFLALCEDNLPTPTIKDPGEHFKTVLYEGDNSAGRRINVGFQPDFIWFKGRNAAVANVLNDTVRGVTEHLNSDSTGAASTPSYPYLNSVNNDGFSLLGGSSSGGNIDGRTYVAWCWKAGGPAVTNTDGSIISQVSVNQDAGFSIATYTATGSTGSIGHGLGKTPAFVITKHRNLDTHWRIWHKGLSGYNYTLFFNTGAEQVQPAYSALPTDSVINLASDLTGSYNFVTYCWAEIEGFSKFGSYVGNASADGSFIYCGFKPAFVITKRTDGTSNWLIHDSSRDPVNPVLGALYTNSSDAEGRGSVRVDFLSNGFKHRNADGGAANNYANNYIFIAFAESPFKTANAK